MKFEKSEIYKQLKTFVISVLVILLCIFIYTMLIRYSVSHSIVDLLNCKHCNSFRKDCLLKEPFWVCYIMPLVIDFIVIVTIPAIVFCLYKIFCFSRYLMNCSKRKTEDEEYDEIY